MIDSIEIQALLIMGSLNRVDLVRLLLLGKFMLV